MVKEYTRSDQTKFSNSKFSDANEILKVDTLSLRLKMQLHSPSPKSSEQISIALEQVTHLALRRTPQQVLRNTGFSLFEGRDSGFYMQMGRD